MSFPIEFNGHVWDDAPSLAQAFSADADIGGGMIVADTRPSEWVTHLVRIGALDESLAVGLAAAMLQTQESATRVVETAHLCTKLGTPELAELLRLALDGMDVGLLLQANPTAPESSVEDVLLHALHQIADTDDPSTRDDLLPRLRRAGLPELELDILLRRGTTAEIAAQLPSLLDDGLTREGEETLRTVREERPEIRDLVSDLVDDKRASQPST